MEETKVIYHIDDEDTPYLVKVGSSDPVTLGDFKSVILTNGGTHAPPHQHFKYFFKSKDDDFGVVKEEIVDDDAKLPLFNGRVIAWLVSSASDSNHGCPGDSSISSLPFERGPGVGETRPPSFHGGIRASDEHSDTETTITTTTATSARREEPEDAFDDTESSITSVSQAARERQCMEAEQRMRRRYNFNNQNGICRLTGMAESSSVLSSEIESSIYDTEDASSMVSSRFTTSTDHTSVSRNALRQKQKRKSRRKLPAHLERASSISSVTDSTLSLNIMTVTLNMDTVNFLGISIVGQSNKHGDGDCGIYVGSIMKGGAVALDGRIDPGDMILQVNDINFENMSNDDAVRVLREVVQKPGPIKLVIAKCWDPSPKGYFTIPRTEPVRPIDPGAWVAHTAAVRGSEVPDPPPSFVDGPFFRDSFGDFTLTPVYSHLIPHQSINGDFVGRAPSVTTLSASSIVSSQPETEKYVPPVPVSDPLSVNSGMNMIIRAMAKPDSGLEVRDRLWLKITISQAFIGSDVVDWLYSNVKGFSDRREARKYATQMLKNGFIKHAVNKTTFSEQCYYVFGGSTASDNLAGSMAKLKIKDPEPPFLGWKSKNPPPPTDPPPPLPNAPPWVDPSSLYNPYPPIYNPAPPPSANYVQLPYNSESSYNTFQPAPSVSSSGSSHPSQPHLRLAGSGSGSESGRSSSSMIMMPDRINDCPVVNAAPINHRISHSKEAVGT